MGAAPPRERQRWFCPAPGRAGSTTRRSRGCSLRARCGWPRATARPRATCLAKRRGSSRPIRRPTARGSSIIAEPRLAGHLRHDIATWSARRRWSPRRRGSDISAIVQADAGCGLRRENVLDAAAVLLALELAERRDGENATQRALSILRTGQSPSGGWGPYVTAGAAGLRHRAGRSRAQLARSRTAPRRARRIAGRTEGSDREAARSTSSRSRTTDGSWPETTQARESGELRAAHLDHRLGDARVAH